MKTLETITLKDFVDVYFGDIHKVGKGTQEEQEKAASQMCMEYLEIVGGKSASIQAMKKDRILRIEMRGVCLQAVERLIKLGDYESAIDIMKSIGYTVTKENILQKIDSVQKMDAYALKKIESEETVPEEMTRDHFIKERVFIMGHMKMHIDENVFKAKEYAYLVRQVGDEIERMNKEVNNLKNR